MVCGMHAGLAFDIVESSHYPVNMVSLDVIIISVPVCLLQVGLVEGVHTKVAAGMKAGVDIKNNSISSNSN